MKMSMSVDGFVVGSRAESDWMFRGGTPDSAAWVLETLAGAGTHAIGRKTFEAWAGFWPSSPSPMAAPLNGTPKVVFTRQEGFDPRLPSAASATGAASDPAAWAMSRVANGDLTAEIEALRQEPGNYILAQGGLAFCRSLVAAELVDEYRFAVLPVALGSGETLFAGLGAELDLSLVSSSAFTGGALGLVYRPKSRG